jgi:hypothetical protein
MLTRIKKWWHETFDNWAFRSMIGPAQTPNAVHGADKFARDGWKRDIERRKQFTRDQRERRRQERASR